MEKRLRLQINSTEQIKELLAKNKNSAVIPIAWPELTARAPEKFWHYLKKARILKNINFKVGHAAMVVVLDSEFLYFDFGRYITPLGFGRTRSAETDPKLEIKLIPKWSEDGKLLNFEDLCDELEKIKVATHGDGPMFASLNYETNIIKLLLYVKSVIDRGYMRYRSFNANDSNCARFVSKSLLAGWEDESPYHRRFKLPVTLAPTPYFNVVAATSDGSFIIWQNGVGSYFKKKHFHALKDIFVKTLESFFSHKAKELPTDAKVGLMHPPESFPNGIGNEFIYLGGIGEAAWYKMDVLSDSSVKLVRHYFNGDFEFEAEYNISTDWLSKIKESTCDLIHDTHYCWLTLQCKNTGEKKRFYRKLDQ
jgi:hypothetical protein